MNCQICKLKLDEDGFCHYCGIQDESNNFDANDFYEQQKEDEEEEEYERALSCTCGAWKLNKKGKPVHIADCLCGAD